MPQSKINLPRELALLMLVATLWGASFTFIKIGVETIPPITFIAARTLIASGVLLIILHLRGIKLPRDLDTWKKFLFQACMNSALPFTLLAWAELSIDAGIATILNSGTPIFTFLITALIIRHEAVTARKFFGVIAGMLGICLVVGLQALSGIGKELLAQLAVVFATVCYAGAAIFGKQFKGLDPMLPATGSLICGAIILLPVSLIVDHPWTLHPSSASVMALFALAVFSTAVTFVIYFRLFNTLGSVGATSQAFLRVPIGVGISAFFLNEALSPQAWLGMLFVIMGVAAMTIPPRKRVQSGS